jgi:hypothetical protein
MGFHFIIESQTQEMERFCREAVDQVQLCAKAVDHSIIIFGK